MSHPRAIVLEAIALPPIALSLNSIRFSRPSKILSSGDMLQPTRVTTHETALRRSPVGTDEPGHSRYSLCLGDGCWTTIDFRNARQSHPASLEGLMPRFLYLRSKSS